MSALRALKEKSIYKRFFKFWSEKDIKGNLLLLAPFLGLYYFLLAQHELWRDEINAWAVSYVSHGLGELLGRVHYEAHPALWYLILYLASRVTTAVWMLKLVQGTIGTGIYLMLALASPFRRFELLLIYAGYYIAFQYTVMCRMYGLEVLFALIFMWFRMNRPDWIKRNVLWLGLIANVDVTASILACGLLLEYLLDESRKNREQQRLVLRPLAGALLLFALCESVAIATLWPAHDISWSSTGRLFAQFADPLHLGFCTALWAGISWYPQVISPVLLWPEMDFWPQGFWVTPILAIYYPIFRGHRAEARLFAFVVLGGIVFSQMTNVAGVRHIGIVYLAFLMVLWSLRFRGQPVSRWSYVLLGALVLSSGATLCEQWGRPFSDAGNAARWLGGQNLNAVPLIGLPDTIVVGVAERLNQPIYQLDCNCTDRVMTFHRRRDYFHSSDAVMEHELIPRTALALDNLHTGSALLLLNFALTPEQTRGLAGSGIAVEQAAQFTRGVVPDEHIYIYRMQRRQ